jgi:hypothetical protein
LLPAAVEARSPFPVNTPSAGACCFLPIGQRMKILAIEITSLARWFVPAGEGGA